MKNPYQSPATPVTAAPESTIEDGANGLLAAGLICALLAAIVPMLVVPAFKQVFESFGADLPLLTIVVLRYHQVVWLLPLLVVGVRLFWPRTGRRATIACRIGVAGMLLVLLISGIALYLPIFRLGAVV